MKWVLADCDQDAAAALAEEAGLHPIVARLLINRGISDAAGARSFLDCDLSLVSSPAVFSGMAPAVERVKMALSAGEKIVVYGDYDVDGVTGASLLYLVLKHLSAQVDSYIPDRIAEGYGLNSGALEKIRRSGARLIITVDCGIGAVREAEVARSLGIDLIITDHHEIPHYTPDPKSPHPPSSCLPEQEPVLPDAFAIIHPLFLLPGVPEGIGEHVSGLSGVGVAFKLAQALLNRDARDEIMAQYLDLVTLGTVADVARITGENRLLVKHGLDRLSLENGLQRPGLAALKKTARLEGKRISAGTVGFMIAPRINASGRLERADTAFRLLVTDSAEEASRLAESLDAVNSERQAVEERIREEARRMCACRDLASTGAFVLSSPEWHPGVIGIVASRIVEEFYRPTALVCIKDGVGKGSARSIPGFDLYKALLLCADLLLGFGGHKYAAGFTVAEDRLPLFAERLDAIVRETVGKDGFVRTQLVDGSVTLEELTMDLVRDIEKLAPFGQGNPEPRLGARGLEVVSSRIVGSNHLKLRLRQQGGPGLDAIAFNQGHLLGKQVRDGGRIAAVFTPRINAWNGNAAIELEIRDIKVDK